MSHGRDVHVPNWRNDERGISAAGSGDGREGNGESVQRVAVMGEREVGNEWSGQRWPENGKRGTLKWCDRSCGIAPSSLFLLFVMNFYFLKKTTTATFRSISSSDYQYDEYHQYD